MTGAAQRKAVARPASRLPVSRPVLWTGIALGAFLAAEALLHRLVLPLGMPGFVGAAITAVLIVALAVVVAELTRRHHRTVAGHAIRHGKRGAVATARHARRHGGTALQWVVAKAAPRWENREHRPLMVRQLRNEPEGAGYPDCWLCGLPLRGEDAGAAHDRCLEAYERDCAKWEIRDDRELDLVERDLRRKDRCPWQIKPGDPGGGAIYCGQPVEDSGADEPDEYCPQHQHQAIGDDEGAAEELNERVRCLLREGEGSRGARIPEVVGYDEHGGIITSRDGASDGRGDWTRDGHPARPGGDTSPEEGSTTMAVSKITPGRRARRTAAHTGGSVPSEWGPVVAQAADFEPESDGHLLGWMAGQVTGMAAYAEALIEAYETGVGAVGIDPKGLAALHDVADAAAHAAETMAAAKQKFTEHYELPREFAANGGLMTHDGRWVTGEGA